MVLICQRALRWTMHDSRGGVREIYIYIVYMDTDVPRQP